MTIEQERFLAVSFRSLSLLDRDQILGDLVNSADPIGLLQRRHRSQLSALGEACGVRIVNGNVSLWTGRALETTRAVYIVFHED